MSTNDRPGHITLPPIEISDVNYTSHTGREGGGSGTRGSSWSFGFGSGGGGFSGGFGGSSKKRAKKRAKAARARAEQARRAQEAAAVQAAAIAAEQAKREAQARSEAEFQRVVAVHEQLISELADLHIRTKRILDSDFVTKSTNILSQLEREIEASRTPNLDYVANDNEPWYIYLTRKRKRDLDELINRLRDRLHAGSIDAAAFNGADPLALTPDQYVQRVRDNSGSSAQAAREAHAIWERAYQAAQSNMLLSQKIQMLSERSAAMSAQHAEQLVQWQEIQRIREQQRAYRQARDEHIRFKTRTDQDKRKQQRVTANTLSIAMVPASAQGAVLTRAGTLVAADAVAAGVSRAVAAAIGEVGRIAAIGAGQSVGLFATAMLYAQPLGNGELTPAQRNRFKGIAVPVSAIGVVETDLPKVAQSSGVAEVPVRLKLENTVAGVAVHAATTGSGIATQIPVREAALDPVTGTYTFTTTGHEQKHLILVAQPEGTGAPQVVPDLASGLAIPTAQDAQVRSSDLELSIDDCIVCVPGFEPLYLSFAPRPPGSGVANGEGELAPADWWALAQQPQGATFPAQVAEKLRWREFTDRQSFEAAFWSNVAAEDVFFSPLSDANRNRINNGMAPVVPRSQWVGDKREIELRYVDVERGQSDPFNFDNLRVVPPSSKGGTRPHSDRPSWSQQLATVASSDASSKWTWTPLVPPGIDSLGSDGLPISPPEPGIYPGDSELPELPGKETYPSTDEEGTSAQGAGFPADEDLPSSGLQLAGPPVEPLEVGPYNDLSGRSRLDGLDIDHIVSSKALQRYLVKQDPNIKGIELREIARKGPSIAIPTEVHRRYSETYGGRNTADKQVQDAENLEAAVDSNFDAIKPGLLEYGFTQAEVEIARAKLHEINRLQGWYQ